jgi:magnesium-transporting ATPase (P-type)
VARAGEPVRSPSTHRVLTWPPTLCVCVSYQTAVFLTFVSAISDDQGQSVLTAVQLLWVNLIMDTMAALALATEPPTAELLNRPPHSKADSLISFFMWRMIIGQAILQVRWLSLGRPSSSSRVLTLLVVVV